MGFRTKLDYSDNRQITQRENTTTHLSGRTDMGVPYTSLVGGPNLSNTGVLYELTGITSTFSANTTSTIFNFGAYEMFGGEDLLNTINTSNSNDDQIIDEPFFNGINSSVNPYTLQTVYGLYTGSTFDITITNFEEISPSAYTGTLYTELVTVYSAATSDYYGDGVWTNVNGKLKTEEIIITKDPVNGYVLTAIDTSGNTAWMPSGIGVDSSPYFISGSTGTFSIKAINPTGLDATGNNSFAVNNNTLASGNNSNAFGLQTIASGDSSHAEGRNTISYGYTSHAEGFQTIASGDSSHAEGYLSQAIGNYSHVEGQSTTALGQSSHAEGVNTQAIGEGSHAQGNNTQAIGDYSNAEGYFTIATGITSHAEGNGSKAYGVASHAEGGNSVALGVNSHAEGDTTEANGNSSHSEGFFTRANGNFSHAQGSLTVANGVHSFAGGYGTIANGDVSFVYGQQSQVDGNHSFVFGQKITGTSSNTTYVEQLNIKTLGVGASTADIRIDANGNVVNVVSDMRLKENVKNIDDALNKILNLRGVTYNWVDRFNGGDDLRMGFIAQEVKEVVPELVYNCNGNEYYGVHYSNTVALLVEAIKELSIKGIKTTIETQTIKAEDNNIELNYNGKHETAIGGGIILIKGVDEETNSTILINENGDWEFSPNISIPEYTPSSSEDPKGNVGNICYDDKFYYIKTKEGWKRTSLTNF